MKTLACFLATWITATALLLWITSRHDTQMNLLGAHITLSDQHRPLAKEFWHWLWVAGVYSILNTFIVRFWQMQVEMKSKGK